MPKIGEAPLRVLGSPPDRPCAGSPPVFVPGDRPDRRQRVPPTAYGGLDPAQRPWRWPAAPRSVLALHGNAHRGQAHESERVLCPKLGKPLLEYLAARRTGRAQALRRSLSLEIVPTGGSGYRLRPMVGWIQRSGPGGWQLPVGALTNASNSDTFTRKGANAFSVMKGVQRHERIAGYLA